MTATPTAIPAILEIDHAAAPADDAPLAADLLFGAEAIALYLFGDIRQRRAVYHLATYPGYSPPFFKLGGKLCARRSGLKAWIETKERTSRSGEGR